MNPAEKLLFALNNSNNHAYLLVGGDSDEIDSLISKIIIEKNCLPEDMIEADENSEYIGKDGEVKKEGIIDFIKRLSTTAYGKVKIGVIKNCEKLNNFSANSLLKTLEEPPKNTILVLSAKSDNILATIKSRCWQIKINNSINKYDFPIPEYLQENLSQVFKKIDAIIKDDQIVSFLNSLEIYFREEMFNGKDISYQIKLIAEAKRKINSNANSKMVLECLILKIRGNNE